MITWEPKVVWPKMAPVRMSWSFELFVMSVPISKFGPVGLTTLQFPCASTLATYASKRVGVVSVVLPIWMENWNEPVSETVLLDETVILVIVMLPPPAEPKTCWTLPLGLSFATKIPWLPAGLESVKVPSCAVPLMPYLPLIYRLFC